MELVEMEMDENESKWLSKSSIKNSKYFRA
jgi:hypothetical protein